MNDVWPPPPKNEPRTATSAPSLCRRLAFVAFSGLFYSCLGAVLLVTPTLLVSSNWDYARLRFLSDADQFFLSVSLLGLILVVVGGLLGCAARDRANGFAALVISAAALCLAFGLVLIRYL